MTTILERLDRMERDLSRLNQEVLDLRAELAHGEAKAWHHKRHHFESRPAPPRAPMAPPPARPKPQIPVVPRKPPFWSREVMVPRLEAADLLGARGLALAGGVVTLLGVIFFFALAASNGWIGPVERVVLGAIASALLFAAGVFAHARYGRLYAAVAAAGAGIAGGYATLLFAAARYDLMPPLVALALAAGIAAVAVALSLSWSSEIVAGFGLIGAMLVPVFALLDDQSTATGTGFVALVFLGAAIVGIHMRWDRLLIVAGAVSVPQLLTLVYQEGEPAQARVLVVAAAFGLLYLGTGIAKQLSTKGQKLDAIASVYAGGNVALTLFSSFVLLEGNARGIALAAAAVVYSALAAATWRREAELSALATAAGSALAAVALAQFFDGPALVVAWAAETAMLAWLGRRLADTRFQLLALAYLILATAYTLLVEAEPDLLFTRAADYLAGVPALLAVAAGAAAYGLLARSWPPPRGLDTMPKFVRELVEDLHVQRRVISLGSLALAGVLAVDAASLSLLELFDWMNVDPAFDWGHVAVTGLWSLVALSLLAVGARGSQLLEAGGLAALGVHDRLVRDLHGARARSRQRLVGSHPRRRLCRCCAAPRPARRAAGADHSRGGGRVRRALVRLRLVPAALGRPVRLRAARCGVGPLPRRCRESGASVSSRPASGLRAPSWASSPRVTCSTARGSSSHSPAARSSQPCSAGTCWSRASGSPPHRSQ